MTTTTSIESGLKNEIFKKALAVSLATAVAFGATACAAPEKEVSSSSQTTDAGSGSIEASSDSVETDNTNVPEFDISPAELEISADLLSDPDALAQAFVDQNSGWMMAGATRELADGALADGSIESYIQSEAAADADSYVDSIFISDWESNTTLGDYVEAGKGVRANTLTNYTITSYPDLDPDNIEPFVRKTNLLSLNGSSVEDNLTSINITIEDELNTDKNVITPTEGGPITITVEFVNEDGKAKVSNVYGQ